METPNPFDPSSLRLGLDFTQNQGVAKRLTRVPARKPSNAWFVRVHPEEAYSLDTLLLELKEEREVHLVSRDLWSVLADEPAVKPMKLVAAVCRPGSFPFLWVARLPRSDGRDDPWATTALEAIELARTRWIRIVANMSLGAYDIHEASAAWPDPDWPSLPPFPELLKLAFRGQLITSVDDPTLRRLRGQE